MVRRRTLIRDPPLRGRVGIGRRGTIIPSLDPITRRRGRGLSDLPRRPALARPPPIPISARPQPVGLRPRPRPRPQLGSDFGVLQPFGRPRPRPTRVQVAQPSGREGRLITVSSRSILARGRKKKKLRPRRKRIGKGQIKKKRRRQTTQEPAIAFPRRRRTEPVPARFFGLQDITFGEGRREGFRRAPLAPTTRVGARGRLVQRRRRRLEEIRPPRRRFQEEEGDFGLGNIFDIQF